MLKNYFIIAIRNLMRHKLYSAINIAGLAMGVACCMLILLYVQYEWRYEAHVEKRDRIYRVMRETARSSGESFFAQTAPGALAGSLKRDFPEIEQVVRTWVRERWVRSEDRAFVQAFCLADPEILDMLNLKLVQGDPKTALAGPGSILVTEETARKFFGEEDAMGKIVTVDHIDFRGDYAITGIQPPGGSASVVRLWCGLDGSGGPAGTRLAHWPARGQLSRFFPVGIPAHFGSERSGCCRSRTCPVPQSTGHLPVCDLDCPGNRDDCGTRTAPVYSGQKPGLRQRTGAGDAPVLL